MRHTATTTDLCASIKSDIQMRLMCASIKSVWCVRQSNQTRTQVSCGCVNQIRHANETYKCLICQIRHTNETSTKEIYSRDVCRANCRHPHQKRDMCQSNEIYKRYLQKRPTKETYSTDVCRTNCRHLHPKETYAIKWDLQKRPTKETHETVSTRICKRDKSQSNQIYVNKKRTVKETHTKDICKSKETYKGDKYASKENYKGDIYK